MSLDILLTPNTIPPIYWMFALAILLVMLDTFTPKHSKANMITCLLGLASIIGGACYSLWLGSNNYPSEPLLTLGSFAKNMLTFNNLATIFDILFCIAGILTAIISKEYFEKVYNHYKEYYSLIAFSIFGMMCIAHANNLLVLFLGIETMSVTFYALTGFLRRRETAIEGALKYFLLGAFASGFLMFGISMLYGACGTMYYHEIANAIKTNNIQPLYLKLGLGLLTVGLLFKVAAFPFHQWAPDVYQAAATPVAGFMSTAGKIAAISGFTGLLPAIMITPELTPKISNIIATIAAITMLYGNITAIKQPNIKRMLAYSSVGHAGYMLIGIATSSNASTNAIIYYSLAYILTQIGAFAVIGIIETKEEKQLLTANYAGISKNHPLLAATLAMFLFSLAGIPPFAGFMGKYFLFKAAIEAGFMWLAIVGVVTSIIACYFYLSIIVQMYFKDSKDEIAISQHSFSNITIMLAASGIVAVSLLPIMEYL